MSTLDAVAMAFSALATQRRRTLLSLLGVSVGVAAVVLLTALGQGARTFVEAQFEGIGTSVLAIAPGKVETFGGLPGIGNSTSDLTLDDALALQRRLPGVRATAPLVVGVDEVQYGSLSRSAIVLGASHEMAKVRGLELAYGAFLPAGDWERGENVVVLGARTARELFGAENALGRQIRIGDWRLRVLGVLESRGVHMGADLDESAFVPVALAMRMFDRRSLFRILLMLNAADGLDRAREVARSVLIERHGREDFTLITPDAVLGSLTRILTVLTLALSSIAAISLGVAGLGIMNVMLVSVSERRSEIGLLRAIGAARAQIVALFLLEAALLSVAGGALGVALGWALSRAARELYPEFESSPPPWAIAAALGVALLVGLVFGVLPARNAARLDPALALSRR